MLPSPNAWQRQSHRLLPLALITLGALGLAGCAEAAPEKLPMSYQVGDIMLPPDLAQSRQNVRELCNTGPEADKVKKEWSDYGFKDQTDGMEWIDAFTYMADMENVDKQAIIDFGTFTYPTIESLAKSCREAAFLVAQPSSNTLYPAQAAPLLEEWRKNAEPDDSWALATISANIMHSKSEQ